MKLPITLAAGAIVLSILSSQSPVLDATELKKTIEGMGFTVKALNEEKGKEKYEFTIKRSDFDIPVAAEISSSKNYVWFTVFLGEASKEAEKHGPLLKENFKIQPNFFYITEKGNLMMGIAVDNRGITPAIVKRITDKLSNDVADSAKLWQSGASLHLQGK